MLKKYILLIITLLSLCACATMPQPGTHYLTWQKRQQQLNNINNWNIYGSLGISYNNQDIIAHYKWQQSEVDYIITLYSTLDIGSVKIVGNPEQVTLWRSATLKTTAKTPEVLMQSQLGWSLPLENLKYWILGLPTPQLPTTTKFDSYNHLIFLQQQNWQIQYSDFKAIKNIDLPTKIFINNPQLRIKIVIKEWQL